MPLARHLKRDENPVGAAPIDRLLFSEEEGREGEAYRVSAKYSWLSALLIAFFGFELASRWQALVP